MMKQNLGRTFVLLCIALGVGLVSAAEKPVLENPEARSAERRGYYRYPAIHGDQIVFTAEGELWLVGIKGGVAHRLTSHPGDELRAVFSPDGKTIAFAARYEGPLEVYTIPVAGGLPTRCTFEAGVYPVSWTPDGKVVYAT